MITETEDETGGNQERRRFDDGSNLALVIDQSEEISDSLKRGKNLSPEQSRSLVYLVKTISKIKGAEDDSEVFSKRLKRFTELLSSAGDKPNLSYIQAENDMDFLLEIANEYMDGLPGELKTPGAMALLRGARAKLKLLEARGGCVSGSELAQLLGIDRNTPRKKHQNSEFIAVKSGGRLRYPLWQFRQAEAGGTHQVIPGIAEIIDLANRNSASGWDLLSFFLSDNIHVIEESNGEYRLPLDALLAGLDGLVVSTAEMSFQIE